MHQKEAFVIPLVAMQQAEGPSAQTQQGPKEAMPPWLARQQPKLADLFGASSSDNEQAPEQAALPANGRADEVNPCTAPASSTQAIRKDTTANNASAESAQNGVSAAGSGLRVNTPQPQLPSSALSANKSGGLQSPAKAAGENPGQHRQRINYSAVAKQLKRHPSGSASLYTQTELLRSAPASRGSSGHVRAKADEAAVLHSGNAEDESETPKGPAPRDLWESADSDEEASRESLDDRSADDNSAQLRSSSAEGRGADRRRNRTREAVRADSTASREAKKPSIPKSLKQALAAQVSLALLSYGLCF